MTYLLTATAASGALMAVGWHSKRSVGFDSSPILDADPQWQEQDTASSAGSKTEIAFALRLALKRLAPVMTAQFVQAELAVPPGLFIRFRATALADLLEELLTAAIHAAPASRLLLTAARRGDRIYVSVTDDMPGADPAVRLAGVRGLMQRVALCGGALDVDVRLQEGTSMTLRFAAAATEDRQDEAPVERSKAVQPASMAMGD